MVQARCHGHSVTVVTAVKRFFKCGGCGAKTSALNSRFPTWGCDRCKRGDWTQCSMYGKRKVRAALEVLCALKGRLPALLASLHCLPPSAARTRWACRIRAPRSMFGKVCNDHPRLQCCPAGARCAKKAKKKKKEKNPKQRGVSVDASGRSAACMARCATISHGCSAALPRHGVPTKKSQNKKN